MNQAAYLFYVSLPTRSYTIKKCSSDCSWYFLVFSGISFPFWSLPGAFLEPSCLVLLLLRHGGEVLVAGAGRPCRLPAAVHGLLLLQGRRVNKSDLQKGKFHTQPRFEATQKLFKKTLATKKKFPSNWPTSNNQ